MTSDPTGAEPAPGPPGRRRGPRKGDLRERAILDAARALFGELPVPAVSVEALAARAGLSRSAFYFYFEGKSAVLAALLEDIAGQLAQAAQEWLTSTGLDPQAMRRGVATSVRLWREHGPLLRHALLTDDPDPALAAFRARVQDRYVERATERIERERAAGRAPAGPPAAPVLAEMTSAVKYAALTRLDRGRGPAQDDEIVDDVVAATLRLIYGRV